MTDNNYTIIRKKGITSSISIRISANNGVVVRAPFWMTKKMIDGFVQEKSSWIQKNLKKIKQTKIIKEYINGEKHLYFGKEYPLEVVSSSEVGRSRVGILNGKIKVELSKILPEEKHPEKIKEALLHWYLERGIEVITERVNHFSNNIGVNYQKIDLKKVSSIWGSCSPTNKLCFNRKLIMAPNAIVDYVIIHEVSHIVHRNHGREFWNLVHKYDNEYKTHRKWLKLNHHLLSL